MHLSSQLLLIDFILSIPAGAHESLDVGSQDVNGCYRVHFNNTGKPYTGLDVAAGPNVDVVVADPYHWTELGERRFDVVVSGQCLEHVEYPWLTMAEMFRVTNPGGLLCVIVPSNGPEHRYPLDCYRYFPDGLAALARFAGFEVLSCQLHRGATTWDWDDTRLIAKKPVRGSSDGER